MNATSTAVQRSRRRRTGGLRRGLRVREYAVQIASLGSSGNLSILKESKESSF